MSRWMFYSPLWLGALLLLALNESVRAELAQYALWLQWTIVAAAAVAFGVHCQVLMTGLQGVFAQVLPATKGRSIRGAAAVAGGLLLIVWFGGLLIGGLLLREGVVVAGGVLCGAAGIALVGAFLIWLWSLPTALADFEAERLRAG